MLPRFLLPSLILIVSFGANASNDSQLWLNAGLRYRVAKPMTLELDQQLRLDRNIARIKSILSDLSGTWRLKKWVRLGLGYRFEREKNKRDESELTQRIHIQSRLKYDLGPATLSYRLRLQQKYEPDGDQSEKTQMVRHRFALSVDRGGWIQPSFSGETFQRLGVDATQAWRKLRLTLGADLRGPKRHRFKVFYRAQMPLADPDDPLEHIAGLGYQFRLRRKKDN